MKKHLTFLIVSFLVSSVFGQVSDNTKFKKMNSVQFETGGHGFVYSFSYERILINGGKFKTTSQAGIAYYPPKIGFMDFWFPLGINELISFDKHHIEFGIGYVVNRTSSRDAEQNATAWFWEGLYTCRLGYRYQKPDGRFILRAGFTPFMEPGSAHEIHPFGGLTVGYNF